MFRTPIGRYEKAFLVDLSWEERLVAAATCLWVTLFQAI